MARFGCTCGHWTSPSHLSQALRPEPLRSWLVPLPWSLAKASEQSLRRQLTAFAQFTTRSLGERDTAALMLDARLRARAGLAKTHAKLLGYLPERDRLLLRSGLGWQEGYGGQYEVSPDIDTPIGHAFALSEPVAVSDYLGEASYNYPQILKAHGCVASLNVPLRTDSGIFGVLEVDDTAACSVSSDDINFLTGLGNTMARAVELRRALDAAEAAVEQKQLLIREMNHRIKNNLNLVSAMLQLQSRRSVDVREGLTSAITRINNMALVHDRLHNNGVGQSNGSATIAASFGRQLVETLAARLNAQVLCVCDSGSRINVVYGIEC